MHLLSIDQKSFKKYREKNFIYIVYAYTKITSSKKSEKEFNFGNNVSLPLNYLFENSPCDIESHTVF